MYKIGNARATCELVLIPYTYIPYTYAFKTTT